VLCKIVANIRRHVLDGGGEINYNSKMTELLILDGKVLGALINGENEQRSPAVFLALGHSARDTFEMLRGKGIKLEQRAISVGVRIEHPIEVINNIRSGEATYSFTYTDKKIGRGCILSVCAPEAKS